MKNFVLILLTLVVFTACSQSEKKSETTAVAEKKNDYPEMVITLFDGKTINAKQLSGKNILIMFQPDCEHCQHEATEIEKTLSSFKDYEMYFVSSAPVDQIREFAVKYKLAGKPHITFGSTPSENILNNFGPIPAPSIYLYNENARLVRSFNGQTDVNEIIKYL